MVNRLGHRLRHGWILQVRSRVAKDYWILGQRWVAGTAVQSVNLFSNEDEKYSTEVIDFQKHCWRL